jgi:hypothetical protein
VKRGKIESRDGMELHGRVLILAELVSTSFNTWYSIHTPEIGNGNLIIHMSAFHSRSNSRVGCKVRSSLEEASVS